MKILMINKFLYPNGGSETYMFKLGEFLQSRGHEVQYFGMEHMERCVGNHAEAYTSFMDFHEGSFFSKVTYPIKTIYSMEARVKIRKVLDDFKPEVCHLNNFNYQLTPAIILEIVRWKKKTGNNCKIVYTAHDYQLICPNHMLNNFKTRENCEKCLGGHYINCMKHKCIHGSSLKSMLGTIEAFYWNLLRTYRHIDTIICCSEFLKKKMDTNPVFASKTVMIHNFVNVTKTNKVEKKDYVLYFGRYSEEKGVMTLLDVCKELPHITFVFAGAGPLEEKVNGAANVSNVGFQTGENLVKLISEARFTVYPSEWYENCPFSVMESQIYLTPVIASNIGGIPELIKSGETGELFQAGNKEELKKIIAELWNDEKRNECYSGNCENVRFNTVEEYYRVLCRIYGIV